MEAMSFNRNQRTVMFASSDRGSSSARSCWDCVASNLPAETDEPSMTEKWKLSPSPTCELSITTPAVVRDEGNTLHPVSMSEF